MPYINFEHDPWTQPPLFEPSWIKLRLTVNVCDEAEELWGGIEVIDGWSGEVLMSTAQAYGGDLAGLEHGVRQLLQIARKHLDNGGPFPP